MGATNQDLKNRTAPGHQPDPSEHDPRNNILVSAAWAEAFKHNKYDKLCAAAGTTFYPFALEATGGHGASTKAPALWCVVVAGLKRVARRSTTQRSSSASSA